MVRLQANLVKKPLSYIVHNYVENVHDTEIHFLKAMIVGSSEQKIKFL